MEKGLVEGRKVYANMTKYIKMTVSSNFGNIFSLLFASIFLPFLPMAPVHLIVLNLVYDISCIALPFDNVDKEFLKETTYLGSQINHAFHGLDWTYFVCI